MQYTLVVLKPQLFYIQQGPLLSKTSVSKGTSGDAVVALALFGQFLLLDRCDICP
jgi:hypothetical protein